MKIRTFIGKLAELISNILYRLRYRSVEKRAWIRREATEILDINTPLIWVDIEPEFAKTKFNPNLHPDLPRLQRRAA